jgi:hypothetical protein
MKQLMEAQTADTEPKAALAPAEKREEKVPHRWQKERDKARGAGAHFKIVLQKATGIDPRPHREFYFMTRLGAESYWRGELTGKGEVTDL